ncbi:MAG: S8 family serine peptidase [Alphaproteobacteria bacterium]
MKQKIYLLSFIVVFWALEANAKGYDFPIFHNNTAIDDIETRSIVKNHNTTNHKTTKLSNNATIDDIETSSKIINVVFSEQTSDYPEKSHNDKHLNDSNQSTSNDLPEETEVGYEKAEYLNNPLDNNTFSLLDNGFEDVLAASPYIYPRPTYIRVIPTVVKPVTTATTIGAAGAASVIPASVITTLAIGGVAAAGVVAAGVGGGGGDSETSSSSDGIVTTEYLAQYGLDMINASSAYARGYTGSSARIALLDGLVDYEHENFRVDNETTNVPMCYDAIDNKGTNDCEEYKDEIKDEATHIAGIIAGLKDGNEMQGVAYDSMILTSNIFPTYDRFYAYSKEQYLSNLTTTPPDPDDYTTTDADGNTVEDTAAYTTALTTWRSGAFTTAIQSTGVLCNANNIWMSSVDYTNYDSPVWTELCSINETMIQNALKHPMTHFFDIGVDQRIGIMNPNYCTIRRTINGVERNLVYSSTNITTDDPCAVYGSTEATNIVTGWLGSGVDDRPYLDILSEGIAEKVIFVWPTGNGMEEQPSVDAAIPLYASVVDSVNGNTVFDEYWIEDPDNPGSYLIKNWVVVNAVGSDGKATNYSNYCGDAKDFCISAPGGHGNQPDTGIYSSISNNQYDYESGTSMATAHVSGALAILVDMFGHSVETYQIIQRLFDTANKTGDYANEEIYGQGLLDLDAATSPVGSLSLSLGTSVESQSISFDASSASIDSGYAFGDGLLFGMAQNTVMALDDMNFPFYYNMGTFVSLSPKRNILEATLNNFDAIKDSQGVRYGDYSKLEFNYYTQANGSYLPDDKKDSITSLADFAFTQKTTSGDTLKISYNRSPSDDFGFSESTINKELLIDDSAFSNPYINLAEDAKALSFNLNMDTFALKSGIFQGKGSMYGDSSVIGAISEFSIPLQHGSSISLQLGTVNEKESFLGTKSDGLFDVSSSSPTWFAGINTKLPVADNFNLVSSYNTAITTPNLAYNSIVKDMSNIRTDNFTFGLIGHDFTEKHDQFGIYVNQPVRVVSGTANLTMPTDLSTDGSVTISNSKVNLTPRGQEINFGAFYSLKPKDTTSISLGLNYTLEPNHIKNAPSETTAILSFRKNF